MSLHGHALAWFQRMHICTHACTHPQQRHCANATRVTLTSSDTHTHACSSAHHLAPTCCTRARTRLSWICCSTRWIAFLVTKSAPTAPSANAAHCSHEPCPGHVCARRGAGGCGAAWVRRRGVGNHCRRALVRPLPQHQLPLHGAALWCTAHAVCGRAVAHAPSPHATAAHAPSPHAAAAHAPSPHATAAHAPSPHAAAVHAPSPHATADDNSKTGHDAPW